jgi:hypothetical protein
MTPPDYRHTQIGTLTRWFLGGGAVLAGAFAVGLAGADPIASAILAATAVILLLVAWLFSSLTVAVGPEEVAVRFGPGLVRKTFAVSELHEARAVRNSWWYGWGVRLTPRGWLYNVSGLDAVEVELVNGRRYRIGTDEPGALVAAIEAAIARQPRPGATDRIGS